MKKGIMTYRGTVRNGVVVFDNGTALSEGTVVKIEPLDLKTPMEGADGSLFDAGDWAKPTGTPDLAKNHDHYLYGHPKRP